MVGVRYGVGIIGGFATSVVLYAALLATLMGKSPTYTTVHIRKWLEIKDAAAESTPSPRLIVIGGSNVLYGISAKVLTQQTELPAINGGTHGSLHYRYYFDWIEHHARRGDIVILSLEHAHFTTTAPTAIMVNYLLNADPEAIARMPLGMTWQGAMGANLQELIFEAQRNRVPSWRKGIQKHVDDTVRETVAANGDYMHHTAESRSPEQWQIVSGLQPLPHLLHDPVISGEIARALSALKAWCDTHGVTLLATEPATIDFPEYANESSRSAQKKFESVYERADVPLLQTTREVLMPREDFYDSIYHLTEESMRERTLKLVEKLRPWLPNSSGHVED